MSGKNIYINIWDDFSDDVPGQVSKTHVQIESKDELDLNEQKNVLSHVFPLLHKNLSGVKIRLNLYDTQVLYPHMDQNACEQSGFRHYKAYQLKLEGITHKKLENFMAKVENKTYNYHGNKLIFISES